MRAEIAELRERGLAGMKFKVGGRSRRRTPLASTTPARPPAPTSSSPPTPTRATRRAGDPLRPPRRGPRPALVRGAVQLAQRPPRDARRALRGRRPRLRRPERALRRRMPRPDGRRRHRCLQLRRLVVRRPDRMAPSGRDRALVRRRDGPSRGAAHRHPSARLDSARHVRRVLPPRARPYLVEPDRQPAAVARRPDPTLRRSRPRLGARRRLHRALPGRSELGAGTRRPRGRRHRRRGWDRPRGRRRVRLCRRPRGRRRPRPDACAQVVAGLQGADRHLAVGASISDLDAQEPVLRQVLDHFGRFDVLAHLAAVLRRRDTIDDVTEDDWDFQLDVNLKATFFLNRAAARLFREQGKAGGSSTSPRRAGGPAASAARSSTRPARAASSR